MSDNQTYIHNSNHKEFIRDKWVEFIQEGIDHEDGIGIITFPAEEMQDLQLFKQKGLIDWEQNETGNLTIIKGKIICFEKSTKIYRTLRTKLVNAEVENTEIGAYLRQKNSGIISGSNTKIFPVDAINLDYDGNIYRGSVPLQERIEYVFKFQAVHNKSFSFFITWPCTEEDDLDEYKNLLKNVISSNLNDPSALQFKEEFESKIGAIEDLNYDQLSLVGLTKIILKKASNNLYQLNKHELYIYGEDDRRKMYSVLFNFKYTNDKAENLIYSEDVVKSLSEINTLQKQA